jgi:hypothetical protein
VVSGVSATSDRQSAALAVEARSRSTPRNSWSGSGDLPCTPLNTMFVREAILNATPAP